MCVKKLYVFQSREATLDELQLVHELKHINYMQELSSQTDLSEEGRIKSEKIIKKMFNSVYIHPQSYKCASLAAGCILQASFYNCILQFTVGSYIMVCRY